MRVSRLEIRRSKLLDAALKVFAQKGYHQTAVSDIVDASRIGHGTFYGYFPNKTAVFQVLVERIFVSIVQDLIDEPFDAANTLDDYRQQILRIGDKLFALFHRQPQLARIVFYEGWVTEGECLALVEQTFEALRGVTARYLRHGVEKAYLRPDTDVETAAAAINAMLFEAIKAVLRQKDPAVEFSKWKKVLTIMMISGLGIHP